MVEGRPFFAHQVLLMSTSGRFWQILGDSSDDVIHISHMTLSTFQTMMRSLHCRGTEGLQKMLQTAGLQLGRCSDAAMRRGPTL
ncbi:PREDICTED: ankyrin repeat and BTB/POZ domain-containing protein BTBD11-A-like [Poecilia mexicana]|uniref:ankyrin repeat and BTB/POZ domain-containing protein BTBD11-A-like n=1 Tax=Poecilia mexicana TaxID=48701 RepID=UPI00072E8ADA|nr:PREDICTED: ankyrin repeat and BTB/POZ domain-containing protein BTBD11-A-like [Poecilia mexicana]